MDVNFITIILMQNAIRYQRIQYKEHMLLYTTLKIALPEQGKSTAREEFITHY